MIVTVVSALKRKKNSLILRFSSVNLIGKGKLCIKLLYQIFLVTISIIFMPLVYLALRIITPFVTLHLGHMYDRMGELVHRLDLHLRKQYMSSNDNKNFYIFFTQSKPANQQIVEMFKRKALVFENKFLGDLYSISSELFKNFDIWEELPWDYQIFWKYNYNKIPPQFIFTEEEEKRGEKELLNFGLASNSSFVCFHCRDKAYLEQLFDKRAGDNDQWRYHDFRDGNINNYLKAADYLTSKGMFAIRMGHVVERPIETTNPCIIDYATKYRSDFMDVYTIAKSKFFLTSTSGVFHVAQAFGVPVAAANWIPLEYQLLCDHDILILKKWWSVEKKRFLSIREILDGNMDRFHRNEDYIKAGVEVIENTPEEILGLAKETNARIDGTWVANEEDEELQKRYRNIFPPGHYCYGFPSRIGADFLRQNKELLD